MSILGALYAAVSGLNANSNAIGIISDNIANANTIGYKETDRFLDARDPKRAPPPTIRRAA